MRHYNTTYTGGSYEQDRFTLLAKHENPIQKDGSLRKPFIHEANNPTLGFGFDLVQRVNDIPTALYYAFDETAATASPELKRAISIVSAFAHKTKFDLDGDGTKEKVTANYLYSEAKDDLASLGMTTATAKRLLNYVLDTRWDGKTGGLELDFDKRLDQTLSVHLQDSLERVALIDYAFVFGSLHPSLKTAVKNFIADGSAENRADVFYEIRFNFRHHGESKGYNSRMQDDSNTFGFVSDDATNDEIKDALGHSFDNETHYNVMFGANQPDVTKAYFEHANKVAGGVIDAKFKIGDIVIGTEGADTLANHSYATSRGGIIFAGVGNDTVTGSAQNDYLFGEGNKDEIDGGAGDDFIFGGTGNDVLIGGLGKDNIDGGIGKDIAEFLGFKFNYTIKDVSGVTTVINKLTGEKDVVKNVELLRFDATKTTDDFSSAFVDHSKTVLSPNDDGYQLASLTEVFKDGLNLFGHTFTSLYVNNNGSVTFGGGLTTYTPGSIGAGSGLPIIAPFWADVDTRNGGGSVSYGVNTVHNSFVVTWSGVDYFSATAEDHVPKSNSFQLEIIDQGAGDAEIIFRYGSLSWTTGDASSGSGGLGGEVARAGINSGTDDLQLELPGSGDQSSMLSLNTATNDGHPGVFRFHVHNGEIDLIGDGEEGNQSWAV